MDTDLVVRAQTGDRGAFARIVEEVLDRFLAIAHRILRDGALAEDATQAALLGVWRDLPRLREPDRFGPWSTRILVNACYSEARRARRWLPNIPLDAVPEPTTHDGLDVIFDRDLLDRAFREVPVDQRVVIVLHHYLGMPVTTVAETLGVPPGTVRSRMHRGMQTLRASLDAPRDRDLAIARQEATR